MMTSQKCHVLWQRLINSPAWITRDKWRPEVERRWHKWMDRQHWTPPVVVEPVPYEWTYEEILAREG